NLYGVINCVKATIDGMCERRWGRIITISSGAGTQGLNIGVSLYGAGKGGGISFMRHLAVECARDGVTANTLALGLMERDDPGVTEESRTVTAAMARQVPVGRLGTPRDIGTACVFLASDEAEWITGQTISINGGAVTT
ncbi:MAG: SDR family oxidoreductase, partial [Actinobacteria bacterium]|nr:SDR family oxidoreductase [Actinomycetota bacterium]